LCMAVALPFQALHVGLAPVVAIMSWISGGLLRLTGGRSFSGQVFGDRNELRMLMQESSQNLSSEELAMINRVLDLQNVTVQSITVPMEKVARVNLAAPAREMMRICRERQLTRLPVWNEKERRVAGIVTLRTCLYSPDFDPDRMVAAYLQPALYLRQEMRLEEALRRLQRSGQRMAVVLGRDRKESGIVTLQDVLRAIFGEVSL
jgi:CBS domain containing-hemolysin-like protein